MATPKLKAAAEQDSSSGRRLAAARRKRRLTRRDVAKRLNLSVRQIKQIELWQLDEFDSDYVLSESIRRYALLVGLNPANLEAPPSGRRFGLERIRSFTVLSSLTTRLAVAVIFLLLAAVIGWQTYTGALSPKLNIYDPPPVLTVIQPTAMISGATSTGAQVLVEGVNLPVTPDGRFSGKVILRPGINKISIKAINRFGREHEEKRIIIYNQD